MSYDPLYHQRKSIRLKGYDYSKPGFYFITILTQNKTQFFCELKDNEIELTELGKIVAQRWNQIPEFYPNTKVLELAILPDHLHGIIEICDSELNSATADIETLFDMRSWRSNFLADSDFKSPSKTIGAFIRGFKFGVTSDHKTITGQTQKVFQRDYYETIIKDYGRFLAIRNYIRNNVKEYIKVKKGE